MKIVFLDIDGVLNSDMYWQRVESEVSDLDYMTRSEKLLDPEAVSRLNAIIAATDAKVIVSSTWRRGRSIAELQALLASRGFRGEVIGKTDDRVTSRDGRDASRGEEIAHWLSTRTHVVESFVIIDDSEAMDPLRENFVPTATEHGLREEDVDRAITVLNRGAK